MATPDEGPAEHPELPLSPTGEPWPEVVQTWYQTWAESPQAATFLPTDWQRLHMVAPLVLAYWSTFDKGLLAEIRLNEGLLGATHADRLRLGIRKSTPAGGAVDPAKGAKGNASADELAKRRQSRRRKMSG